jgi:hypothetical protein
MAVDKLVDSAQLDADLTSVANAIRTKGGTSAQLTFPAGFVQAIADLPTGGGGGATVIASGTYTGAGTVNVDFPVGKKMPKKDFVFHLYAPDETVFAQNADYKIAQFHADSWGVQYDLSANSDDCTRTTLVKYTVGASTLQAKGNWYIGYVRNTSFSHLMQGNAGWNRVKRDSNGFHILMRNYNELWYFPSGMTYNWELLYIGSDPTNDIVEVP